MDLYDFTFYDLIKRNAASFRQKAAWLEAGNGAGLSFEQFKEGVERLATGLQQAGLQKGERLGVIAQNRLEYFLLYGAAAALGAIMAPINWRLSPREMLFNLNDAGPKFLFVDADFQVLLKEMRSQLESVEQFYNLGSGGDLTPFEPLMENGGGFTPEAVAGDDPFVIIHTAAVAGRPRGAILGHSNLLCGGLHFGFAFRLTPQDVHLSFLPYFHAGGLFMAVTGFLAGALTINMPKFEATRATQLIADHKVSLLFTFSPILASILEAHQKEGTDIGSLRTCVGLDTAETIEAYQKITGGTFFSLYGQTETSAMATLGPYNERPGAAGKMLPLTEICIVDDYDRPLAAGQTGEICVRGPMVFKGYWNLPEDTAYTFREGWHHTGDLGRFDEDGFLWYAGRKAEKELIKPGGENVYPAEVEKVILEHPAVAGVVVFGVPDPKWKEGIKAVCTLKPGQGVSAEELIDFVGQRIARFKKPHYVQFVAELPLLEDGTPDREKIKALYSA